jgi:Flp pilus assembly protein TadG
MHRILTGFRRPPHRRDERGTVAIIVALSMTALLVVAAMVLDFGLVRTDRQVDKSAADSATMAGLHGLNGGDGTPHPYIGVCTAVRYLKANSERFSTVNESAGWTDGLGTATANGCSDVALRNRTCSPTDKSSWARWSWSGTSRGVTLDVTIESGYDLALSANQWADDTLPASSADTGAACDQLAVTIKQSRKPGLGALATSSDLVTAIRTVGRVKAVPGDKAPAMLLLKRTGCPVLRTGSNSGGSYIHVLGAVSSNGLSQPGTIHSDSDGVSCTGGSNSNIYIGNAVNGIVAYAAPLVSNPSSPDPAKPGSITSVAAANGLAASIVRDSLDNVYGSSALNGTSGTKAEVTGRSLVTRRLVDERYFPGVKPALAGAAGVFASLSSGPPATGWVTFPASVNECKPTQSEVDALGLSAADNLYINCNSGPRKFVGNGNLSIPAGTVYFRGSVNPAGKIVLPNAHHVYVENSGNDNAIDLGTGASFEMHTSGNQAPPTTGNCTTGRNSSKAVLFVKSGVIKQSGTSLLRLCRTTVFMMGGRSDGCVPASPGTAPTRTPCTGGSSVLGTGQFTQQGGDIDWTAPDSLDVTTDPVTGDPLPIALTAWSDPNGPEDLALWSESGSDNSNTYNMAGGGLFNVRGVYMVPNADPFIISGGGVMNLTNAQYVASSIELNGSTTNITMSVDPHSAVTLPDLALVGLVR